MSRSLVGRWTHAKSAKEVVVESRGRSDETSNQQRVAFAVATLEQLAAEAAREGQTGTIGIEIPVKEGKLGKVKRVQILFQED